jgi:hypothetical protein
VRRFASRFSEVTGIAVEVEARDDLRVADRLAAEAFQMVAEGLSNVRRHTQSPQARVGLALQNGSLHLRIENPAGPDPCAPFTPRSIAERAAALGGGAIVLAGAAGGHRGAGGGAAVSGRRGRAQLCRAIWAHRPLPRQGGTGYTRTGSKPPSVRSLGRARSRSSRGFDFFWGLLV